MNRVLIVGLGSMGKRRLRLLRQVSPDIAVAGVDSDPERRQQVNRQFGIDCYPSIGEAADAFRPQGGLVCTSPLAHRAIILELLERGLHVFTEINLVADG